ncbi:cutinase family protein [Rhodococcus sp. H29-C3]|uniref:cutinase family protein n=1 Tax=Rhodococcus sp. H29-C3 TaxID=3046307 RepID=UPI0024BB4AB5|nr:cutinase family protein [Rhodococcus sp. H29-C3]MDJ0360218.1 cutinase family protein [Rhodococcus sp. H29-C3]
MRRRTRAGSILTKSATLGVALLLAVPAAAAASPESGSSTTGSAGMPSPEEDGPNIDPNNFALECPDILMLAVSGATDSDTDRDPLNEEPRSPMANWVGNVTLPVGQAGANNPGSVGWLYVPYPSTYGVGFLSDVPTYQESVAAGVASTNRLLDEYKNKCGENTKFVLLGYSVGGEVVERVAMELGHRAPDALVTGEDIAGVALLGDPYRPAGVPNIDEPGPTRGGFQSPEAKDYGTLNDKMTWACRPYDLACDAPENILALQLALGVLGQMRLTVIDPVQSVADFARTVTSIATRTIVDIVTQKDWVGSEETLLEVLLKVSDQTYQVDEGKARADLTPERLREDLDWAMGPGAETVRAKVRAEGEGLVENNKGIVDVLIEPYIFLGFLQHLLYWNNNPKDGRAWESEKIVAWVTDLAETEREKKGVDDAPLATSEVDPNPAPDAAPVPEASQEPNPQTLPTPGTLTRDTDLGALLDSFGVALPPGVFPPQYSTVPEPTIAPSIEIVPQN